MAELSALRARLKDRQVKDGALGTTESKVCLDLSLINELRALEDERRDRMAKAVPADPGALAGYLPADTSDLDERIEAKKAEIRENTVTLKFKSLSTPKYQTVVNRFEDPDDKDAYAFQTALAAECHTATLSEGDKIDLGWDEILPELSPAEFDEISNKVFTLNKRKQPIPF